MPTSIDGQCKVTVSESDVGIKLTILILMEKLCYRSTGQETALSEFLKVYFEYNIVQI